MSISGTLDAHIGWLADRPRVGAFRAALGATIQPGHRVVDIGTGTGVLAVLACEAGAAHVYAIDEGPIIGLAREIAQAHGVADRITFLRGHSSRVTLPERVDVAVADLLGYFAFEPGIFDVMRDARARHLLPGGRTIPEAVSLHLAPVESPALRERVAFWTKQPAGIDMTPAHRLASNAVHPMTIDRRELLGAAQTVNQFELSILQDAPIGGQVRVRLDRDGTLDGVAGWFTARLAGGVSITNAPDDPCRLDRPNVAFPLPAPVAVSAGDEVVVTLRVLQAEHVFSWNVDVFREGTVRASHRGASVQSLLLSSEDLGRVSATSRPELNDEGGAERLVLQMADGFHTVAEIEAAVREGFGGLFPSRGRAAEFVAEILVRLAR